MTAPIFKKKKDFFDIAKGISVYIKDMEDEKDPSKTACILILNTNMVALSTTAMHKAVDFKK